jgi:imidazolonepropionase
MSEATIFANARQVVTCAGAASARRGKAMADAVVRDDVAVAVVDSRIAAVGPLGELRGAHKGAKEVDCARGVLTPGLVDSHTHAIFGRARYEEQEYRAAGMDYMEVARRGGGIHSSVRDLRSRSEAELETLGEQRLRKLAAYGVTTVEVKSGYGLSLEDELKTLRVIRRLGERLPMRIIPTFLGAHEIPLEFRDSAAKRREYIGIVINEMLPAVERDRLARFADVFCETGVYTVDESREILGAARKRGLQLKLHADELTSSGGAELAAEIQATSADHLAAVSADGIRSLAGSGTVATLLPGTMSFLGKMKQAPARVLIEAGVPVALATDFNPGTSPTPNFPLVMSFGLSQLKMSAHEVFIAATVNGAAALGEAEQVGQLASGFSADIALWDAEDFREIPYWYGDRRCRATWARGKACHQSDLGLA